MKLTEVCYLSVNFIINVSREQCLSMFFNVFPWLFKITLTGNLPIFHLCSDRIVESKIFQNIFMLTSEVRESLNFYFQKPCRAIFSGSSQSGKTYLVGKILEEQRKLFNDEFQQIIYYYFRVLKFFHNHYFLFVKFWSFV